jgi:hypothetical protein
MEIGFKFGISISLETIDNGKIDWKAFEENLYSRVQTHNLSGIITLRCSTMKAEIIHERNVPLEYIKSYGDSRFYIKYDRGGSTAYEFFYPLESVKNTPLWFQKLQNSPSCPVTGIFVGRLRREKPEENDSSTVVSHIPWVLACLKVGSDWERIGHFRVFNNENEYGVDWEIEKFNESLGLVRRDIRLA